MSKGGRPMKYSKDICKKMNVYFTLSTPTVEYAETYREDGSIKSKKPIYIPSGKCDYEYVYGEYDNIVSKTPIPIPVPFPTLEGFADSIGVHKSTLLDWAEKHEEFSDAYARAKAIQEAIWAQKSLTGEYNAAFAIMAGKNWFGYKDKSDVRLDGKVDTGASALSDILKQLKDE